MAQINHRLKKYAENFILTQYCKNDSGHSLEHIDYVIRSGIATLEAIVPVATSMNFPERLATLSSGKAVLAQSFYGYRECRDGEEHVNPRRGVNPLDRSKWILWARGAYQSE